MIAPALFPGLFGFWPFANAWMLWWAAAALIPILLHFWNRHRYQETPWAAMEYLLAAVRNHARRLRIEHLILLAVRIAIVVLLALALANPVLSVLPSLTGGKGPAGNTHIVLVLDGSYSMDYQAGDQTCFARAKTLAKQLVEQARQGDGFSLIYMAQPPRIVIGQVAFDPDDVTREIESLQRTDEGADLLATCAAVEDVLQQTRRAHPRLGNRRVYFLTDLGQTTWGAAATAAGRAAIARLGDLAKLEMIDVGNDNATNLAIVNVSAQPAIATAGRSVRINVQVENFSLHDRNTVRVVLLVDGQHTAERRLTVAAGGQATVSMVHPLLLAGGHVVEARLDGDALAADNRRWLSLLVRPALRVLCIAGKPGAATNVALALEPAKSRAPRIVPMVRSESALLDEDLQQYDAIFVCNVGRLGRRQADLLRRYVERGGGIVWCLGDQVDCADYNRVLVGDNARRALLPGRLIGPAATGQYHFDPRGYQHPIIAPFRGNERAGLLTTPVWKYIRVQPLAGQSTDVVLAFQNGDPAILEHTVGRGRVILVTTAVSPQSVDTSAAAREPWSALPVWPSFPPLVQEMLKQALVGLVQNQNLLVGEPIEAMLPSATSASWVTVTDPNGVQQRVPVRSEAGQPMCDYSATDHAGIYVVQTGTKTGFEQRYAVNVDTRESSVDRFDPAELPSEFRRARPTRPENTVAAAGTAAAPAVFFRYLLAAVLVLLLVETFLAWFFGKEAFSPE